MIDIFKPKSVNICQFISTLPSSLAKKWITFGSCLIPILTSNIALAAVNTTKTGIPIDVAWKQKIYDYAQNNVKHSAWGLAHSERDYQVSIVLAEKEGIEIDKDVIFAAAFLHDIGAIDSFRKKEVEHSARSIEIIEPLLEAYGFPMQKWTKVKAAILGHMYYADRPTVKEAIVLHDADALDFLGSIGIVRLISVTERHTWAKDLSGAFVTLQQFKNDLPNSLITNTAKKIAKQRILEMNQFFSSLNQETFDDTAC